MEEAIKGDMEATLAEMAIKKREKKNLKIEVRKKIEQCQKKKAKFVAKNRDCLLGPSGGQSESIFPGISVSEFDYSVDNHFQAIDRICKLCGETGCDDLDKNEIERLSSSITFLREWKLFNYQPRMVRFACQSESCPSGKDTFGRITLPQFSSATVPNKDGLHGDMASEESSKDFVMYVGGSVWALDWCPKVHQTSDCDIKCEFIAVAAHPPESSYHKIGAPLVGRGIIQIWCILNDSVKEEDELPLKKKPKPTEKRGRPRKDKSPKPKRPRGRPRKKPSNESLNIVDGNNQCVQALAIQFPENSSNLLPTDTSPKDSHHNVSQNESGEKQCVLHPEESADNSTLVNSIKERRLKNKARTGNLMQDDDMPSLRENEDMVSSQVSPITIQNSGHDPNNVFLESQASKCLIPKDIALPRVVLCLAHNGKVAWDAKWRPPSDSSTESKHRMGYLAVVLGNGALEVWEVPLPQTMKVIYSSCQKQGTDARFVKLEPIFRCSKLKCGDRQSIPLTVEWSASSAHDFILAGCHDGVVALWKFSANGPSKDTRPLLCFSADTVPIRAVSWAPAESDPESANVIVTAGHRGLKFWDIRDPFRPLWDLNPVQHNMYSLDWLPNPRCVVVSFDDGTLRILSLVKAAYDVPVTGKPFSGTQQQGLNSYSYSSSPIWNVHASRRTGMVAYCCADGNVLRFQLTAKAVEKDFSRNRASHFLCASLCEEESSLTVIIPSPDTPVPMKKSLNESANVQRSIGGSISVSNQARRTKEQMAEGQTSESQTLALCYGDDPGMETEPDDTLISPEAKQALKSRTAGKKKLKADQALMCRDEEPENVGQGDVGDEIETLPSKLVAMQRVRWNMNKGSERWLCYGGAAGIVRCQEINRSAFMT
ncbi:hypothetical protein NMG60_11014014 [Bertholletia excelsa]